MQISSKGNKILLFSDWHQEADKVSKIIRHEIADLVVDLGDEFDSRYYNSREDWLKTIDLRKQLLASEYSVVLYGNHTISYLFPNMYTCCSGYNLEKQKLVNEIFPRNLIKRFKFHLFVDDFLCTHAGLANYYLTRNLGEERSIQKIDKWLEMESNRAIRCLRGNDPHWFYAVGQARKGRAEFGGLLWLDFRKEFISREQHIHGINQIFGHTNCSQVTEHCVAPEGNEKCNESRNFCIDSSLAEYITITSGKLEIKRFADT